MQVERLDVPDVLVITPKRFGDSRGFFSETYNERCFAEVGIQGPFVQDNHSLSAEAGVVRGLHCQIGASVQGKLLRVVRGAIWDVAVDIRHGSPTYGRWAAAEISAENWAQIWIPPGFLHGFCTLTPNVEVIYKVTALYDPASERGVRWNDPDLALPWPIAPEAAVLSEKDQRSPHLSACEAWFHV